MTDQTRADFEKWAGLCSRQQWQHKDGTYKNDYIQARWEAWQAALAAGAPGAESDFSTDMARRAKVFEGSYNRAISRLVIAQKHMSREQRDAFDKEWKAWQDENPVPSAAPVAAAVPGAVPTDEEIAQAVENVVDTNGFDVQDEYQGLLVLAVTTAVVRQLLR